MREGGQGMKGWLGRGEEGEHWRAYCNEKVKRMISVE